MLNVYIQHKGAGKIKNQIDFFPSKFKMKLKQIADEAREDMTNRIEGDRKRSKTPTRKPHLSDLIEVTETDAGEEYTIGVGNIKFIENMHRDPLHKTDTGQGWRLLNFGGLVPGGGKAVPGNFVGTRFVYGPGLGLMHPKKIAEGIRFIENAAMNASVKIKGLALEMKI